MGNVGTTSGTTGQGGQFATNMGNVGTTSGKPSGGRGGSNSTTEDSNPFSDHRWNLDTGRGRQSGGRGGSSSTAGNGDPFADDRGNVDEVLSEDFVDIDSEDSNDLERGRGSNLVDPLPAHPDQRTWIYPLTHGFTEPRVNRQIIAILKIMFNGPWTTWRKVPADNITQMWDRFCGLYQWEPRFNVRVEMIFRDMLKNRFSDVLSTTRTDAMNSAAVAGTRVDDRDYDAIKPYNPSWIDPGDWATMIDTKWKTDKWRKNSEINKENKATSTDGEVAKHTSGSVSFELTEHRMEKETGLPVNSLDWYKECHLTRARKSSSLEESGNTSPKYVTRKAQKVAEYYEELLDDTYGPDRVNHPHIGDLNLWLKACGGMKKGRLFGYGAPHDPCLAVTGVPSAESTMTSDYSSMSSIAEVERLKTQLDERDKKAEEREKAAQERERAAEERERAAEEREKILLAKVEAEARGFK